MKLNHKTCSYVNRQTNTTNAIFFPFQLRTVISLKFPIPSARFLMSILCSRRRKDSSDTGPQKSKRNWLSWLMQRRGEKKLWRIPWDMCFTSLTKSKSWIPLKYFGFHWVFAIDLFCSATLCDWLNKSWANLDQKQSCLSHVRFPALCVSFEIHSDWLIWISVLILIGQGCYLGLTSLNWKPFSVAK